jgi:hypothetical protein
MISYSHNKLKHCIKKMFIFRKFFVLLTKRKWYENVHPLCLSELSRPFYVITFKRIAKHFLKKKHFLILNYFSIYTFFKSFFFVQIINKTTVYFLTIFELRFPSYIYYRYFLKLTYNILTIYNYTRLAIYYYYYHHHEKN